MLQADPDEKKNSKLFEGWRESGSLYGAGVQIAAGIVLMAFIGWWIDTRWGTTPWIMVLGICFGAAAGMYQLVKTVNEINKKEAEKKVLSKK